MHKRVYASHEHLLRIIQIGLTGSDMGDILGSIGQHLDTTPTLLNFIYDRELMVHIVFLNRTIEVKWRVRGSLEWVTTSTSFAYFQAMGRGHVWDSIRELGCLG